MNDKDNLLFGDRHIRFGIEDGEVDTKEVVSFLKILKDLDFFYKGRPEIAFEFTPLINEDVKIVMANFKRVFNEAWSRILED